MAGLVNLGIVYSRTGKYEKAEELFLQAKNIFEVVLNNQRHPFYINCLMNLSQVYYALGNYDKYEPLSLQVKELMANMFGREHPHYAVTLINLSSFYNDRHEFEKAEPLLLEAKEIFEVKLGMTEHPHYLNCLSNLGILLTRSGKRGKAEALFLESLSIREKTQGTSHPDYASNLLLLADVYAKTSDYEKAESLYLKSASIFERAYGKEHEPYLVCQHNLAGLYIVLGNFDQAETLLVELSPLNQALVLKSLRHLSEQELNAYLKRSYAYQDLLFSTAQLSQGANIAQICYDNILFYKGFLLNAVKQTKRLALSSPLATEKFNQLKSYERRLATEYLKPISERDSSKVAELEEDANVLEKELARSVAGYGQSMRQVKWQEVQRQLKQGEAAVEFIEYNYFDKGKTDSTMYAALLLRSGNSHPKFISLFEEKQLNDLLKNTNNDKAKNVNHIYENKSLYKLLWQPLESELKNINAIYYSPTGLLHRLNLNAIQNEKAILGDQYKLVQVNSTRQLATGQQQSTINNQQSNALLFGGIEYDMDSTAIASAIYDYEKITTRGSLNFSQSDSTMRGGSWDFLDWTEIEVSAIESILKESNINTTLRDGYKATEEAFKSITSPSPRILHIATHGFFFPDPESSERSKSAAFDVEPVFKISDHPMIRSGLILAGGNHAWQTGKPLKPEMEDGILTAYEISQMDLSNTELVVLSACETGLGDIEGNEGVYGLQRAFKIAGAKYLIMSLWQVPDYQTQQLMKGFYKKWLVNKMNIPDAFRSAQQEMKEKYKDPFLWAGFVLVE